MPVRWERDDQRRLVTVTVSEPFSLADLFGVLDRHATGGTWDYALIWDGRQMPADPWFDPTVIKAHVLKVGDGQPPGPIAVIIGEHPERVREALRHPGTAAGFEEFEILITPAQVEDWMQRHTRPIRS